MDTAVAPPSSTDSYVFHRSFIKAPQRAVSASANWISLSDGRRILDACGGAAVSCIGQANEEIIAAATEQMRSAGFIHSMTFTNDAAEGLAEHMLKDNPFGFEKVYFVCSGSEAMDTALKLARQYFYETGERSRVNFISRKQSYHGNTIGAMAVSSNLSRKIPYEPLQPSNVRYVTPANSYRYKPKDISEEDFAAQLAAELEQQIIDLGPETVIAFIAEPVVGATTGCVPAPPTYFRRIRQVCDKYGVLLILDEVMCGTGRTGTFYAFEQEAVAPDILTMGKGLGAGYAPIAAVIANKRVVDGIKAGTGGFVHGHTYQAHPLSCAVSLAVQKFIKRERLVEQCRSMGEVLERMLKKTFADCQYVGDIRGRGLFWGIEFVRDKGTKEPMPREMRFGVKVQEATLKKGVAVYPGSGTADGIDGDHVLLAPAYNFTEQELLHAVSALRSAYDEIAAETSSNPM